MACWYFGKRLADEHWWETPAIPATRDPVPTGKRIWPHGEGPLCIRCGLPKGTWQWETAADAHREEHGHGLGTGACEDAGHDEHREVTRVLYPKTLRR